MEGKGKPGRKAGSVKDMRRARTISLPESEWEAIDDRAKRLGISRSELIRRLVRIFLEGAEWPERGGR